MSGDIESGDNGTNSIGIGLPIVVAIIVVIVGIGFISRVFPTVSTPLTSTTATSTIIVAGEGSNTNTTSTSILDSDQTVPPPTGTLIPTPTDTDTPTSTAAWTPTITLTPAPTPTDTSTPTSTPSITPVVLSLPPLPFLSFPSACHDNIQEITFPADMQRLSEDQQSLRIQGSAASPENPTIFGKYILDFYAPPNYASSYGIDQFTQPVVNGTLHDWNFSPVVRQLGEGWYIIRLLTSDATGNHLPPNQNGCWKRVYLYRTD